MQDMWRPPAKHRIKNSNFSPSSFFCHVFHVVLTWTFQPGMKSLLPFPPPACDSFKRVGESSQEFVCVLSVNLRTRIYRKFLSTLYFAKMLNVLSFSFKFEQCERSEKWSSQQLLELSSWRHTEPAVDMSSATSIMMHCECIWRVSNCMQLR